MLARLLVLLVIKLCQYCEDCCGAQWGRYQYYNSHYDKSWKWSYSQNATCMKIVDIMVSMWEVSGVATTPSTSLNQVYKQPCNITCTRYDFHLWQGLASKDRFLDLFVGQICRYGLSREALMACTSQFVPSAVFSRRSERQSWLLSLIVVFLQGT